jgi:hypothetical protein
MRSRRSGLALAEVVVAVAVVAFLTGLLVFAVGKMHALSRRARSAQAARQADRVRCGRPAPALPGGAAPSRSGQSGALLFIAREGPRRP